MEIKTTVSIEEINEILVYIRNNREKIIKNGISNKELMEYIYITFFTIKEIIDQIKNK